MNKLVDGIRAALKPHHVEGFGAMCFPMPNLQQMGQLMKEVERLENLANQKEATILALSLKAESWETATCNARSEVARLQSSLTLSREEGRREGMMRAAEITDSQCAECSAAIRSEAKGERG